jgi:hypothetical protein
MVAQRSQSGIGVDLLAAQDSQSGDDVKVEHPN